MALTPEQLVKLTQKRAAESAQQASNGNGTDEMTAGERSAFLAKIERMFQRHIKGQGNPNGSLVEQIKTEVANLFKSQSPDDEKVMKFIEKQFGEVSEDGLVLSEDRENQDRFSALLEEAFKNNKFVGTFRKFQQNSFTQFFKGNTFGKIWKKISDSTLGKKFNQIGSMVKTGFSKSSEFIKGSWKWLRGAFSSLFKMLPESLQKILGSIKSVMKWARTATAFLFNISKTVIAFSRNVIKLITGLAVRFVMFIVTSVIPMLFSILATVTTLLVKGLFHLATFLVWMTQVTIGLIAPMAIVLTKILLISALIVLVFLAVFLLTRFIIDLFSGGLEHAIQNFFENFDGFWQRVQDVVESVLLSLDNLFNLPPGTTQEFLSSVLDWFSDIIGWVSPIMSAIDSTLEFMDTWIVKPLNVAFDFWKEKFTELSDFWETHISEPLSKFTTWVWDKLVFAVDWWVDVFQMAWTSFVKGFKVFANLIIDGINGIIRAVNAIGTGKFEIPLPDFMGGSAEIGPLMDKKFDLLEKFDLPELASGGIVTTDILARIGEGSAAEAIIPLTEKGIKYLANVLISSNFSEVLSSVIGANTVNNGKLIIDNVDSVMLNNVRNSLTTMDENDAGRFAFGTIGTASDLQSISTTTYASVEDIEEATGKLESQTIQVSQNNNAGLSQISKQISDVQNNIIKSNRRPIGGIDKSGGMDGYIDLLAKGIIEGR